MRQGKNSAPPRPVNVQVAVRCRPLNPREISSGERSVLVCAEGRREVLCSTPMAQRKGGNSGGKKTFTYDHVFGPDAGQEDVYEGVVRAIVDEVLEGYNCTVFAYGQTGTGKTYTMEGGREGASMGNGVGKNAGIIPRAVKQVFDHLRSITDEHSVRVSHLELYNEQLSDLLSPNDVAQNDTLRMYEDPAKGTFVQGLEDIVVTNEQEIFAVLDKSAAKRRTAETLMNKYSSRSHSVFSITIHIKQSTPEGADLLKVGKLNLVDLAGSENIGRSGAIKGRAREAGNINQSLLTLGRVITALVDRHPHIPYRDSKLTRLLQESLGGRNKTCIIATVTPGSHSVEETASTLDYAYRAKSIKNRPQVNQMIAKHVLLKEYTSEILKLKKELDATRAKNGVYLPPDEYERLQAISAQQEDTITQLETRNEDFEKKTADLRKRLNSTVDELNREQKALATTKVNLKEVSEDLARTKVNLARVELERDENAYLVRNHVETEAELHRQGNALQDTVDDCIGDIHSLHARVDARGHNEKENLGSLAAMQNTIGSNIATFCESAQAHEREQIQLLKESESNVDKLVANIDESLSQIAAKVKEYSDWGVDFEETGSDERTKLLKSFSDENRKVLDAIMTQVSEEKEAVSTARSNIVMLGDAITRAVDDTKTAVGEIRKCVESHNATLEKRHKNFTNEIGITCGEIQDQVSEYIGDQKGLCEELKTSHEDQYKVQQDLLNKAQEKILADVKIALESLSTQTAASISTARAATNNELGKLMERSSRLGASIEEATDRVNGEVQTLTTETERCGNDLMDEVDEKRDAIVKLGISTDENSAATKAALTSLSDRTNEWNDHVRSDVDTARTCLLNLEASSLKLQSEQSKRLKEKLDMQSEECRSTTSSVKNNVNVSAEELVMRLQRHEGDMSKFAGYTKECLTTSIEEPILAHKLLIDETSGPPKREWAGRSVLAATRDHDVLRAELRREKGIDEKPAEKMSQLSGSIPSSPECEDRGHLALEMEVDANDMNGNEIHGGASGTDGDARSVANGGAESEITGSAAAGKQDATDDGGEGDDGDAGKPVLSDTTNRKGRNRGRIGNSHFKKPTGIPAPRSRGRRVAQ